MFYFSVFIILQYVYNQLTVNIRSSKRLVRYVNDIILMIEWCNYLCNTNCKLFSSKFAINESSHLDISF